MTVIQFPTLLIDSSYPADAAMPLPQTDQGKMYTIRQLNPDAFGTHWFTQQPAMTARIWDNHIVNSDFIDGSHYVHFVR
jgi:hypothetical protein